MVAAGGKTKKVHLTVVVTLASSTRRGTISLAQTLQLGSNAAHSVFRPGRHARTGTAHQCRAPADRTSLLLAHGKTPSGSSQTECGLSLAAPKPSHTLQRDRACGWRNKQGVVCLATALWAASTHHTLCAEDGHARPAGSKSGRHTVLVDDTARTPVHQQQSTACTAARTLVCTHSLMHASAHTSGSCRHNYMKCNHANRAAPQPAPSHKVDVAQKVGS